MNIVLTVSSAKFLPARIFFWLVQASCCKRNPPRYIYICLYTYGLRNMSFKKYQTSMKVVEQNCSFPPTIVADLLLSGVEKAVWGCKSNAEHLLLTVVVRYPRLVFIKNRCFSKGTWSRFSTWALHPTDHLLQGPLQTWHFLRIFHKEISQVSLHNSPFWRVVS